MSNINLQQLHRACLDFNESTAYRVEDEAGTHLYVFSTSSLVGFTDDVQYEHIRLYHRAQTGRDALNITHIRKAEIYREGQEGQV